MRADALRGGRAPRACRHRLQDGIRSTAYGRRQKGVLTLYFSGTGNSRFAARLFAQAMGGACRSIEDSADFSGLIRQSDAIAFVYPIYSSRIPRIMREFVAARRAELHGKKLVILCTQMGFSGDGARCFTDLLDRGTYRVLYAEHLMMPNNINNYRVFPRQSARRIASLAEKVRRRISRICGDIRAGVVKKRGFNPFSRLLGLPQGLVWRFMEKPTRNSVWIGGECTGCGLCVKSCPMRNLTLKGGKAAAHGNCTVCYRCINLCPQRAVGIYSKKRPKWQYLGPGE
jgi:ferredoxin